MFQCSCSRSTSSKEDLFETAKGLFTSCTNRDVAAVRQILQETQQRGVRGEDSEELRRLLSHTDADGQTALHIACGVERNIRVVKLLIDAGASLSALSTKFGTPLNVAVAVGDTEVEAVLLNAVVQKGDAAVCFATKDSIFYETPLHTAIRRCDVGMAQALIASGADINACIGHEGHDRSRTTNQVAPSRTALSLALADPRNQSVAEMLQSLGARC